MMEMNKITVEMHCIFVFEHSKCRLEAIAEEGHSIPDKFFYCNVK